MTTPPKRPRDPNQLAKIIIDIASGTMPERASEEPSKNPAAVALGRLGGLKGGKNRAAALSEEEKKVAAQKAARARWTKREQT